MRMSNTEKAGQSHHWDKTWPGKNKTYEVHSLSFCLDARFQSHPAWTQQVNGTQLGVTLLQDDGREGRSSVTSCSTNAPIGSSASWGCSRCAVPLLYLFFFTVQFLVFQGWVPRRVKQSGVMSWWRWSCCSDGIKVLHESFQVGHLFGQLIWFVALWERERVTARALLPLA